MTELVPIRELASDRAIALIAVAEHALEEATTIGEALDLRTQARALEVLTRLVGMQFEVEQKATILRLRTERKIGEWLDGNVHPGGVSLSSTMTLPDLGISRNQSSRWQAYATLSLDAFDTWLDEHIAKGYDITGAGLYRYAVNANPDKSPAGPLPALTRKGVWLIPPDGACALQGFRVNCVGPLTGQHILNKSKARGNEEVRAILVSCPGEIMANVCASHNVDRWADTKDAQRILLLQKVWVYGFDHMRTFFATLPWKVPPHDLTLEALLA